MLSGGAVDLVPISTTFTSPIAIEYSQVSGALIVSDNYPTGNPHTFDPGSEHHEVTLM